MLLLVGLDHAIILKSVGSYGDRVSLLSPLTNFHCSSFGILSFQYYLCKQENEVGGHLEVRVLSELKVPLRTIFNSNGLINAYNTWHFPSEPLPPINGSFYVEFVAVTGKLLVSDVILDAIKLECSS